MVDKQMFLYKIYKVTIVTKFTWDLFFKSNRWNYNYLNDIMLMIRYGLIALDYMTL